jgi:hypothetical protein
MKQTSRLFCDAKTLRVCERCNFPTYVIHSSAISPEGWLSSMIFLASRLRPSKQNAKLQLPLPARSIASFTLALYKSVCLGFCCEEAGVFQPSTWFSKQQSAATQIIWSLLFNWPEKVAQGDASQIF